MFKGIKRVALHIEAPREFDYALSLEPAKQIDLMIPVRVLERADRVIK